MLSTLNIYNFFVNSRSVKLGKKNIYMEFLQPKTSALGYISPELEYSFKLNFVKHMTRIFLSFLGHWHRFESGR